METSTAIAAGTIGAGLLQGIMQMESDKRKLALDRAKFGIEQQENRFSQQLAAQNQQMQQPMVNASQQSQTLQGLISALGGTR